MVLTDPIFAQNGKFMVLDVPIFKHFTVSPFISSASIGFYVGAYKAPGQYRQCFAGRK